MKKTELEIGKWYVFSWYHDPNDVIGVYLIDKINYDEVWFKYGVNISGNYWSERDWYSKTHNWRLATPQEVEQALVEEANRRYKVGDKLSLFNGYVYVSGDGIYSGDFDDLSFCIDRNTLAVKTTNGFYQMIFNNGEWAAVIEQDKLSRLKEAHRNGAVIQFYNNFLKTWSDVYQNKPTWDKQEQYRIKPEEKQAFTDSDLAIVERLHDTLHDKHGYPFNDGLLMDARMLASKIKSNIK